VSRPVRARGTFGGESHVTVTHLDRSWIERHIPHQGSMCLLEEVLSWDEFRIECRSSTHRAPDNPLRAHGRLGVACGIEYAAQAMAVHGALIATIGTTAGRGATGPSDYPAGPSRSGYLASIRNVTMHVTRLDDLVEDLISAAVRVAGDDRTILYDFTLRSGGRELLSGRAGIVFGTRAGLK
jgi:predicted hotdog family 3-hydroxylacyl-ACP dehydratase